MPELRHSSLVNLDCFNNRLSALPEMPASLSLLFCNNNPWLKTFLPLSGKDHNKTYTLAKIFARLKEDRSIARNLIGLSMITCLPDDILIHVGWFISGERLALGKQIAHLKQKIHERI
jgi:hypothetical protein